MLLFQGCRYRFIYCYSKHPSSAHVGSAISGITKLKLLASEFSSGDIVKQTLQSSSVSTVTEAHVLFFRTEWRKGSYVLQEAEE